ncbi:O-methyltransferase-domain-containing protein [Crucibulum laeve]|uniref:O-methyltransferase-domain-containing protein n=1 Tax=Crucibulum laeve TaxID=68775 RepID=A0A5C3LQA0_9AGAR|nr:O-methyltransferase-domain-containing protein [Crucibulum laeve]
MTPAHGQISALVTLISDATKIVESYYEKSSKPYIPSLDDIEPHPFDNEILGKELRNAIQTIEGACAQLSATVARPSHTTVNRLMGVFESSCLNVAVRFKISDVLKEKREGMHISEIGQKAGVEERKIGRVLRCLSSKHYFREVSKNVFANNRLSIQLLSSNPLSSLAFHFTDEGMKSSAFLSETLADPEWGHSYAAYHSAFNKYTKYPGPLFMYYENTVQGLMLITMQLAKAYPSLKLVLQDLPKRIQQAKNEIWPKECPQAIQENRIRFEPIDFFNQPPVDYCTIYYLKNIIHDWPDADCIKILSQVKSAMGPHSRVLIQEYILQHANRVPNDQSEFEQAPEPLLPNYGAGRIRQYNLDIDMITMLNSEERTGGEFIRLGEAAGLKFTKVWDIGELGLVEFSLP